MHLEAKKIAVLGLGKSGVALAKVLSQQGAQILVSDARSAELLSAPLQELKDYPVAIETGGHSEKIMENEAIVVSPGVPVHSELVTKALNRGLKVMGEVEVAWRLSPAPFIAVTGTNGKSTTVTLIDRMLGEKSVLAGNIGNPLVAEVAQAPRDGYVTAEISSFQLETVYDFRPHVAILTNVTPDHLDRHPDLNEYFAAKARLFAQQQANDLAIFSADDPEAKRMCTLLREGRLPAWLEAYPAPAQPANPQIMTFSVDGPVEQGTWYADGAIYYRANAQQTPEKIVTWDYPGLPGPHNLANALAAIAAVKFLGVSNQAIHEALAAHAPLHYRMEEVRNYKGVRFIDDSKGTNPSSVIAALKAFTEPLILIAGGKDKGMDFSELGREIALRTKMVILIGEAADRLEENIKASGLPAQIERSNSMQEAIGLAWKKIQVGGGVILLSPACSSFDQFKNAEERGRLFAEYAAALE